MDGLSAAASVIAVIQIAQSIGSALQNYYEGVRDARDDIKKLYNSVTSLREILWSLHQIINRENGHHLLNESLLTSPSSPLRQTELELHKLRLDLKVFPTAQRSFDKAVQSLIWPLKRKDIEKAIGVIEKYKSSLILDLQVENIYLEAESFDILDDIKLEIRAARFDETRRRVIIWLSRGVPNPSEEYNFARSKHEGTTGSWLLESKQFKTWQESENSLLWLNGGAGSGKSILSSTVINHVQEECKGKLNTAVAYWYFTFTDVERQKVPHCLCSLIADICSNRRDTPIVLQEAYDRANYGQQNPTQENLLKMLEAVLIGMDNVYIIIDDMDECPKGQGQRDELLTVVHELYSLELSCLHILLTSRREIDIEDSFNSLPSNSGNLSQMAVHGNDLQQDIQSYLKSRFAHRTFEKWKPALKEAVQTKLSTQADGMFRLAALQLDTLSQLRTEAKIMAAMRELPRTLDAIYDRILLEIENEEDQKHAYRALQWLALAARPISLEELAEAVVIQTDEEPYLNEEDQFMDFKDLLDILPAGLVTTISVRDDDDAPLIPSREFHQKAFYVTTKQEAELEMAKSDLEKADDVRKDETIAISGDTGQVSDVKQAEGTKHTNQDVDMSKVIKDPKKEKKTRLMIQFAHFSVKEYLVSARVAGGPTSKYYIDSKSAELEIAQCCFAYLLYVGSQKPVMQEEMYNNFPLLQYAANCWPYHMENLSLPATPDPLKKLTSSFLRYDCPGWQVWDAVGFDDVCKNRQTLKRLCLMRRKFFTQRSWIHPLSWIAASGISCLMADLLAQKPNLDDVPQTLHVGNPLYAAAVNGRREMVEVLLAAGADVNYPAGAYHHSLQAACFVSQTAIVKLLLEAGAEVNAKGGHFDNALQAAAFSGSLEIVQMLVQAGADLHAEGGYFSTPLQAASSKGHSNVVSYLLGQGVKPNVLGGCLGSALRAAKFGFHSATVSILVEHGAVMGPKMIRDYLIPKLAGGSSFCGF